MATVYAEKDDWIANQEKAPLIDGRTRMALSLEKKLGATDLRAVEYSDFAQLIRRIRPLPITSS
ncbi:MAG: hypothetical protein ACPGN3_09210 [Opitutales bacterium]